MDHHARGRATPQGLAAVAIRDSVHESNRQQADQIRATKAELDRELAEAHAVAAWIAATTAAHRTAKLSARAGPLRGECATRDTVHHSPP